MRALELTKDESAMLEGGRGPGVAFAMRMVASAARVQKATRLIPIVAAHVDSCLYHGPSSLDFVRRLLEAPASVSVPTTLNVGGIDLMRPNSFRGPAADAGPRRELMERYVELGCSPTFTCAPYQLPGRPERGQDVAWAESNAIVFANSVLGARTNRYGDLFDIACAVTGRVPEAGLHLEARRAGRVIFAVESTVLGAIDQDLLPALLGHHVGRHSGAGIPVVTGLPPEVFTEDWGKAFGAAAASSGGLAMFHVVGSTPEAPTLEAATQGLPPISARSVTTTDLDVAASELSTAAANAPLAAVSLGTPHLSREQLRAVARHVEGRRVRVPTYVSTARRMIEEDPDAAETIEQAGVTIVRDTCTYLSPVMTVSGVVLTNSAKWAYYAPANLGLDVVLRSQSDCLESALVGYVVPGRRSG